MSIVSDEQVRISAGYILHVSFDNSTIKLMDVERILSIYEAMYPIVGTRYVFLDKIQYTENWKLWMKVIYDGRKDIRLVATGENFV